jgi:hypothetical protein
MLVCVWGTLVGDVGGRICGRVEAVVGIECFGGSEREPEK